MFWDHKTDLLGAPRSKLDALVHKIVTASSGVSAPITWVNQPSPIQKIAERICICANADLPCPLPRYLPCPEEKQREAVYLKISSNPENASTSPPHADQNPKHLHIDVEEGKRGQYQYLQNCLPLALAFVETHLRADSQICISCDTGKDLSVGVALAALQKFWDSDGVIALNAVGNVGGSRISYYELLIRC